MRASRTVRNPGFVAAVVIFVAFALILSMNMGADRTSAAVGPKQVKGFVWDSLRSPISNANVTVESLKGAVLVKTLYVDATDSIGYYTVTFGNADWDLGNTLRVTARDGGGEWAVNSTIADEFPFQWVNVTIGTVIPEFGDGITAGLTIASFAAMVVIMMSRRRRDG